MKGQLSKQISDQEAVSEKKRRLFFFLFEEMSPLFKLHMKTFSYFYKMGLLLNIKFLSSKQNSRPNIDPKMLKQEAEMSIVCLIY